MVCFLIRGVLPILLDGKLNQKTLYCDHNLSGSFLPYHGPMLYNFLHCGYEKPWEATVRFILAREDGDVPPSA